MALNFIELISAEGQQNIYFTPELSGGTKFFSWKQNQVFSKWKPSYNLQDFLQISAENFVRRAGLFAVLRQCVMEFAFPGQPLSVPWESESDGWFDWEHS